MKNKEFIIEYFNAISGKIKTHELLEKYITDKVLIEHIIFFDGAFPKYELVIEEILSEGDQVILRARMTGNHEGQFGDIFPTHKHVDFPFAIGYKIENGKINSHWLIADQMVIMEQLGVEKSLA
ncbi:MAG: ester cyclase [Dyadobacter sp.]